MHFIYTYLLLIFSFPILGTIAISQSDSEKTETVNSESNPEAITFEVLNQSAVPFKFTMKYEGHREIIKIRSEQSIKSLRIVDHLKGQKNYNVIGSDLIIIPKADFKPGEYIAEFKFMKSDAVIISKIMVGTEEL